MSAAPTSQRTARFRHGRVVWLLGFVIVAGVFAAMLFGEWTQRPSVRFPDGTVLTFAKITEPTPPPAGSYLGPGTGTTHVPPDVDSAPWWRSAYYKTWMASPAWLQRWMPQPKSPPMFLDPDAMMGYRHGIAKHRLWFESIGPDLAVSEWTVSIEGGLTRGKGYGGRLIMGSGSTATVVPATRWFYVNTDSLPSAATLKVHFSRGGDRLTVEIPHPKYRAEGN